MCLTGAEDKKTKTQRKLEVNLDGISVVEKDKEAKPDGKPVIEKDIEAKTYSKEEYKEARPEGKPVIEMGQGMEWEPEDKENVKEAKPDGESEQETPGRVGVVPQWTNCYEILRNTHLQESGVYTIYVSQKPLRVYCDMTTDGGGWTVRISLQCLVYRLAQKNGAFLSHCK